MGVPEWCLVGVHQWCYVLPVCFLLIRTLQEMVVVYLHHAVVIPSHMFEVQTTCVVLYYIYYIMVMIIVLSVIRHIRISKGCCVRVMYILVIAQRQGRNIIQG